MPVPASPARLTAGALLGAAALLATTLAAPAATSAPAHREVPAPGGRVAAADFKTREEKAQAALSQARKALSPATPAAARPDATMALRRLVLLQDALTASDRAAAERLLSRPIKPKTAASGNIRLHWDPVEVDGNPYSAQFVLDTMVHVSNVYKGGGYRKPLPDGTRGRGNKTDVYVDDLGIGLYGYCTSDDPNIGNGGKWDTWAFCVVDNDYAGFPFNTPRENLQVTAAHEYFHAVQYSYDFGDDGHFIEGTAAWAEDELYDSIDDNRQYLKRSPITKPKRSMDKFEPGGLYHYGTWIFYRYLSEKFPQSKGGLPKVVLDMWKNADSSKGPNKDRYSVQAIDKALSKRNFPLEKAFSMFSDANRRARQVYDEGSANNYPSKPLAGSKTLKNKGQSKRFKATLDHLTSATFRYTPKGLSGDFELKLVFDLADKARGARAVVTVYKQNGKAKARLVGLNGTGNGSYKADFSSSSVGRVEVTLVNASSRMKDCYPPFNQTLFSCQGKPVDQDLHGNVKGTVVK